MGGRKDINAADKQIGCLHVIERDRKKKSTKTSFWLCICENCNEIVSVSSTGLRRNPKSCVNCKMAHRVYPKHDLPCKTCGILTSVNTNRYATTCSDKCWYAYQASKVADCRSRTIEAYLGTIITQVKSRAKRSGKDFNLDIEFILDLYKRQKGKCPKTGVVLESTRRDPQGKHRGSKFTASLDRIDSNKGYTRDNVQLVTYHYNLAKNCFTEQELLDMCRQVVNHADRSEVAMEENSL